MSDKNLTKQEKELVAAFRQLPKQAQKVLFQFTVGSALLERKGKDIPSLDINQAQ